MRIIKCFNCQKRLKKKRHAMYQRKPCCQECYSIQRYGWVKDNLRNLRKERPICISYSGSIKRKRGDYEY